MKIDNECMKIGMFSVRHSCSICSWQLNSDDSGCLEDIVSGCLCRPLRQRHCLPLNACPCVIYDCHHAGICSEAATESASGGVLWQHRPTSAF